MRRPTGDVRQSPHHQLCARRQCSDQRSRTMAQASGDPVSSDSVSHCLPDHKTHSRCHVELRSLGERGHVDHQITATCPRPAPYCLRKCSRSPHAQLPRKHEMLGGQAGTAFAAPGSHDGPASTRAHPEPEPVRLGTATIIWLESTLAHRNVSEILLLALPGRSTANRTHLPAQQRHDPGLLDASREHRCVQ